MHVVVQNTEYPRKYCVPHPRRSRRLNKCALSFGCCLHVVETSHKSLASKKTHIPIHFWSEFYFVIYWLPSVLSTLTRLFCRLSFPDKQIYSEVDAESSNVRALCGTFFSSVFYSQAVNLRYFFAFKWRKKNKTIRRTDSTNLFIYEKSKFAVVLRTRLYCDMGMRTSEKHTKRFRASSNVDVKQSVVFGHPPKWTGCKMVPLWLTFKCSTNFLSKIYGNTCNVFEELQFLPPCSF